MDVIDPATEDLLASVGSASADQVAAAAEAARGALREWIASSAEERAASLRHAADLIDDHRDELADDLTRETGRTRARNALYVEWTARLFRQYAELGRVLGGRLAPSNEPGQLSLVQRVPYGVVAAIVPWNYPFLLLAFKAAPALVTGNTLVVKPAPETGPVTERLIEIIEPVFPPGVVNVVQGGPDVGSALVDHDDVHLVAFTGSTGAGRRIGARCGELGKPAHLELGGKDAAIVFDDVDPKLAAKGAVWAAFLNAGQVCTSTERAYVHASVYADFVEEAVRLTEGLAVGDPFAPTTDVGPMRSESGRRRVEGHLAEAAESGAKVLTGGHRLGDRGFFLTPAVVVGVDHSMQLMTDETFGPVLPVMPFADDDEAFALAGDTPYGLGASLYTQSARRVQRASQELVVGTVWVNDPVVDNLAAPFGGMRASGNARELGVEALYSFTSARHIHWNVELEPKPWWFGEKE